MRRTREARDPFFILAVIPLLTLTLMSQLSPAADSRESLTKEQASAFARLALKGLNKEYPNKPEHVMATAEDVKNPKTLHPAFYGCYDWHSSVHGHWMLARLLKMFPDLPETSEIRAVLGTHLAAESIKGEVEYFARPESKPFERPYGWAWLLKLTEELNGWDDPDARQWAKNLRPLADVVVERYLTFFPKQTYPISNRRAPEHGVWTFVRTRLRAVGWRRPAEVVGRGASAVVLWK